MTFVASDLAVQMYYLAKHFGRPLPRFSDDDVLDQTERLIAEVLPVVHQRS